MLGDEVDHVPEEVRHPLEDARADQLAQLVAEGHDAGQAPLEGAPQALHHGVMPISSARLTISRLDTPSLRKRSIDGGGSRSAGRGW